MLAIGDVVLRAVNFVFLIIGLGLTISLAATPITQGNPQVNFCVFACAFAILTSTIYGVLAYFFEAFAWPVVLATFDFLNAVFTFSGATALAAAIRATSCSERMRLVTNSIAQGSEGRCRKAQASSAFIYFAFFVFFASSIFSIATLISGDAFTPPKRLVSKVGVPATSQA